MINNKEFQELLENTSFRAWVFEKNTQDDAYWTSWVAEDISRKELVEKARTFLLSIQGKSVDLEEQYIDLQIRKAIQQAKKEEKTIVEEIEINEVVPIWKRYWAVAASVIVLLGATWFILNNKNESQQEFALYQQQISEAKASDELLEVINEGQKSKLVQLPDGSSIVLQKNSRLSYKKAFDAEKREVYLVGEAFFEVAKNPERPFFVYANELVTKVLGTSFTIKAFGKDQDIRVIVKTGRVSVFTQTDNNATQLKNNRELTGMVLTANQQAIYQRQEIRLVKAIIDNPVILTLPIENQKFEFVATPISEVFGILEESYGVDIVYDEEVMSKCSITAKLGDEPLFEKLKWICSITESSYEVSDGQIIITGKPCK
ncbi:FecR family protein [Arcicella rosea]|uniref:FecR family protein n=1 Tax=Arcicella rosea TaxID=502909 RepID=A0A841ESA5_9BACT|nr:FecR family protein [Arcicella rosea]MBB6004279.1 hypothetical protein [Arcicella rosea]